jgi:hypothetical protein
MRHLVQQLMESRGVKSIDEDEFHRFCKHSTQIEVVEMRSIADELTAPDWETLADEFGDPESTV